MVPDMIFESHPGKLLEIHTKKVLVNYEKSCQLPIGILATLFHDLGKLNSNFQRKLRGENIHGYSHHAYLSVIIFYNFLLKNEKLVKEFLKCQTKEEFRIYIHQIIAIIAHHHGNLPDFSSLLNSTEASKAIDFYLKENLPASVFLYQKLNYPHDLFSQHYDESTFKSISIFNPTKHGTIWRQEALRNFINTQFAFASLIEGDKRDAGNNEYYGSTEYLVDINRNISQSLVKKFQEIDIPDKSELNKLRTAIRQEACKNVTTYLADGKRVFTLTAPTGAGKTFSLLAVAATIQEVHPTMGVLYTLPFLSITEQVKSILDELNIDCLPVNSKAQNDRLEEAQNTYEREPTQNNLEKVLRQSFSEDTFDHPFILTTFVQFFETLVSNRNSTLLKLPNFRKRIFIIDEIQALPPRLYIFFTAWLQDFCKQYDSCAILSTATMPKFQLPDKTYNTEQELKNPRLLFKNYRSDDIAELIEPKRYFFEDVFNRYKINLLGEDEYTIKQLAEHILVQKESCLIILNTITDTKELYQLLNGENAILLNTHFIPEHRTDKINLTKEKLKNKEKIILISTQLIEAGVDIDFPIVYRDLCPLPSLIQSAGRCNRNKQLDKGQVFLFRLVNDKGKASSDKIYRNEASDFLRFCKTEIKDGTEESQLFYIQERFFEKIKNNLSVGEFISYIDKYGNEHTNNFIECINKAEFEKAGKFQLIVESSFGKQYQYYIRKSESDNSYNELVDEMKLALSAKDYEEKFLHKKKMNSLLKKMSNRLLTVKIYNSETAPLYTNPDEYFGIRVLADLSMYSPEEGINMTNENCFL